MDNFGYKGQNTPNSAGSDFNLQQFMMRQLVNEYNIATLVKVVAVTNNGGVSPVGFVDVLPLVSQLDGHGVAIPHGVIHNVPYSRLQGGTNAVIMDPAVNDIGMAVFADRDISSVKATRAAAPPGSKRRSDMADGMYIGGLLNAAPSQYVQFSAAGITLVSPVAVTIQAPATTINSATIVLNGNTTVNGNLGSTGTMENNGKNVGSTHTHGGVQTGSSSTAVPN